MAKPIELARVHGAAYHFAFISRDKLEIAHYLDVSERTIHRYAKMDEWHHALDIYGYKGERTFLRRVTRHPERDHPDYKCAKREYLDFYAGYVSKSALARRVERATGIPRKRIREWARKYDWLGEASDE